MLRRIHSRKGSVFTVVTSPTNPRSRSSPDGARRNSLRQAKISVPENPRALPPRSLMVLTIAGLISRDNTCSTTLTVEQVLSREINPAIVKTINDLGGKARGFSGTEIFACRKLFLRAPSGEDLDLGFVGEVTTVNTEPLRECIRRSITPVISPTARDEDGKIYNCNADVAAAQAAIALKARRLVFMSDVPGLLRNPKDP